MIVYQKRILREDLQANPDVLYLFGDNRLRKGMGGQAREMRGEPNAIGVRTKKAPSYEPGAFLSDDEYQRNVLDIGADLKPAFAHRGVVVVPLDGLGTGLARLSEVAPLTYAYLEHVLRQLEDGVRTALRDLHVSIPAA